MQDQQGQKESASVTVTRSLTWKRVSTEVRPRPDERVIVDLLSEGTGLRARLTWRSDAARTHIVRVDFLHELEDVAQAHAMYAVGDVYAIRAKVARLAPKWAPGGWRPMSLEISEPGAHVGATWFQIDGLGTRHVMRDLFGDVIEDEL